MSSSADLYAFGSYRLDTASRILTRSDAVIALPPKTFDLLILLAGSKGRLMSRRELMDLLWRDTAVEEANLSFQISTLRKALGEEGTAGSKRSQNMATGSMCRWNIFGQQRSRSSPVKLN